MALRDRLGAPLRESRLFAALELLLVSAIMVLKVVGALRNPALLILPLGWLSLWLRRSGWRQIGMARPADWRRTVFAGITIGIVYNVLDIFVMLPLLHRLTGEPLDLSQVSSLQGNLGMLLALLAATWTLFAFGEEMAYRGYIFNRLEDVFGRSTLGTVLSVAVVSVVFGFAHGAQGPTGILDNIIAGVALSILYLASGRNLWLPIVAHGVEDTTSFLLLYLGFHP